MELEGAAGGGFIDAADLGGGGDGDGFGGVAEGGDDALFLACEAGEEVAEDELEGIIARRIVSEPRLRNLLQQDQRSLSCRRSHEAAPADELCML